MNPTPYTVPPALAVQFTRFLAEADAAGAFTAKVIQSMADSMDLEPAQVSLMLAEAQSQFDTLCGALPAMPETIRRGGWDSL